MVGFVGDLSYIYNLNVFPVHRLRSQRNCRKEGEGNKSLTQETPLPEVRSRCPGVGWCPETVPRSVVGGLHQVCRVKTR